MGIDIVGGVGVALGFLIGIVAHEFAHAALADMYGDKTSRLMRRVTLSPKQHIDPLGTLILPAVWTAVTIFGGLSAPVMFGWGKRHNLNIRAMRNPKRTALFVFLAGPIATLGVAAAAGTLARFIPGLGGRALVFVALVNSFLTVIEILPIPGRDGARILALYVSPAAASKIEDLAQYEALFLLVILIVGFLAATVTGMALPLCSLVSGGRC